MFFLVAMVSLINFFYRKYQKTFLHNRFLQKLSYICLSIKNCVFCKLQDICCFKQLLQSDRSVDCLAPVKIYLFKVNNGIARTMSKICSRSTIKTPERCQLHHFSDFIVNFGHISICWIKTTKWLLGDTSQCKILVAIYISFLLHDSGVPLH